MSNGHFIEKCQTCGTVIRQCRCPDRNKPIVWATCATCLKALAATGARPPKGSDT